MIKTAIIGASGYIGRHLINKYREVYPDCIGTCFSTKKYPDLVPFNLCEPNLDQLDLNDYQAVLIASAKPNIGYCENNKAESYALNVTGTLECVRQIEKRGLTTIFLSSDYVFDGKQGQYLSDAQTCPNTEYGRQKALVEREIPNLTDNYFILRLSKIYGTTFQDGTLIDLLASDLLQGKKQLAASDQFFSPTHVKDVVSMVQHAQKINQSGVYNTCHNNAFSRFQISTQLADLINVSKNLIQEVSLHSIPGLADRPLNTSLVGAEIFSDLQPHFVSMKEAIHCVADNWNRATIRNTA